MNQNRFFHRLQAGFTLVELLIVVIILSILAAIALPQFSASTDDAKLAALDSTLGNMRSVIDLYYQQHGAYPGKNIATGGSCPLGGAEPPAGAADTVEALLYQLTYYTNAAGEACTAASAEFKYGPYLKKSTFPENPWTGNNVVVLDGGTALGLTGADPGAGWLYNTTTGQFVANDSTEIPPAGSGVTFDQL